MTLNISRSGVLFCLQDPLRPPPRTVEIVIHLSAARVCEGGVAAGIPDLHCSGKLARISVVPGIGYVAAVAIDREEREQARAMARAASLR